MQDNDLISRAALVEDLSYCAPELFFDKDFLLHKIMRQPVINAAPVVHAKWEMDYSWHGHCRCSNCHGTSIEAEWLNRYMWPYCPNCGAKMDGGD